MKKSTVIATCLKNSGGSRHDLWEIESSIEQTFLEDFPGMNYKQWNTDLPEAEAKNIIRNFGSSYNIDIRRLIIDLT